MRKFITLNNYSIKKKLSIIYITCVLIPLIITDSIIYFTTEDNLEKEQRINLEHVMERIEYNIKSDVESAISVSNYLYADSKLNDLITTKYEEEKDFYEKYNMMLQSNVIKYYFNNQKVYKINIYTSNNTIISGSNFFKLTDDVRKEDWYKKYKENNGNMTLTTGYNRKNRSIFDKSPRELSIVRKLDYYKDDTEKIMKIDMDYDSLAYKVLNEKMNDNLYICTENNILFSNKDSYYDNKNFGSIYEVANKDVMIEKEIKFSSLKEPWKIKISADKVSPISSENSQIKIFLGILVVFNLVFPTIVIYVVSKSLGDRVKIINNYLDMVKHEEFNEIKCVEGKDEIGELIRSYNLMVRKIKQLIEVAFKEEMEKKTLQLSKNQAELRALQSQVNPHFLFNILESIRMRSLIKSEDETAEIIEKLALLLRTTINWGDDHITIEDEINFVDSYLKIQQYRFGEKLSYEFKIDESSKNIKIPKLTILSLVENSCVHGIEGIARNGNVYVNTYLEENYLIIKVFDTGCGMDKEQLQSIRRKIKHGESEIYKNNKSLGLLNAYMRMQKYCNNTMEFYITSVLNKGTDIVIKIDIDKIEEEV
ncbi:histidine kinase [Clostridium sp. SM-530-WT-3G]|uniref:histidine kinase n=1 Tax=Clostridium sp. SM-530-WT-3G TaxID=2725303 RepID=UPI00145F2D22|nr:histidine kinase [Clostridium sp. SM-530-WT-3G]